MNERYVQYIVSILRNAIEHLDLNEVEITRDLIADAIWAITHPQETKDRY